MLDVHITTLVQRVLNSQGSPLSASVRDMMEARFGHEFGHVRLHTDALANTSARALCARAYAFGSHIVFGEGRFNPETGEGLWLLAHELAHVIQQGGMGSLQPSKVAADDDQLECEANRAADLIAAGYALPRTLTFGAADSGVIQRQPLTKDEQQALDQLKATCAKNGKKAPQLIQSCAMLKQQLDLEERLKQAELDSIARDKLAEQKRQALAYVTHKVNSLQTTGTLLLGALLKAGGEYDQILAARASQPVFLDILTGLVLTALPEVKLLGRTTRLFLKQSPTEKVKTAMVEVVKEYGESSKLVRDIFGGVAPGKNPVTSQPLRRLTFADSLDSVSKDAIEALKNPSAENAKVDEETSKRFAAFQAKNQILSRIVKNIQRSLVAVDLFEGISHQFIVWHDGDVLSFVQQAFKKAELDNDIDYNASAFDVFADLILYDMLRAYVKTYVIVVQPGYYSGNDRIREGLDNAQLKLIYAKFRKVPWSDPTRPAIANAEDLIAHWANVLQPRRSEVPRNWPSKGRNAI